MAVPAYATDLNDIFLDGAGSWTLVGGGRQTAVETDDYIQGTSCWSHDPFSSGLEGGVFNSAETIATDDAVFVWIKCDVVATIDTHANGGQRILIGNSATALKSFYVLGSDDYQYGGWKCIPVDPTLTQSASIGTPTAVTDWFGGQWSVPGTGASKGYPMKVDAMRHGRQVEVTAGEIANPASWETLSVYDSATTRQWGICQPTPSGAEVQGLVYWGTAGALVYSRDSNKTIAIIDTEWTVTDFTQILFAHASNDIEWDNVGLLALGTSNRGIIDVTANGAVTWTNSVFQGIDITNLLSGCTFDGSKWLSTNEVDSGGGSLLNAKILTPTVAANSYGLLWDIASDPDGKLDGMEFSKGTTAHHAITFGTAIPSGVSYTLRDCDFGTDFSATEDGTTGDETFHFLDTTGTITLNLVGCTGNAGYRSEGVVVTIVQDPVTTLVTALTTSAVPVQNARVIVETKDGTGPLPFEEAVTIVQAAGVATVTHTAHGISDGKQIVIRGTTQEEYNKVAVISVVDVNSYTYSVDSGAVSPATGSPICSAVIIQGLTDVNGEISDLRTLASNQPVKGRCIRSTTGDLYQTAPLSGTIDSVNGLVMVGVMILD